jgi:SLT domain-containing protein
VTVAGAGTLWVTVKPSLEGFGTDLRRQIEQSVPSEIRVRITPDGDPAQDGAQQAGAFADAYKARLKAALADLPKVEITADSSDADRAIADIRARMETLRDARIGIDIDAGAARAELAAIEAELSRLAAQSPNVQVRVDAAAAASELAAVQAEVAKLDGEQADVKVDTSSATSSMSALMTAGLALGPALIPIGASIAAGLASIGPAALAGAGALGVLGLAFSGIGKAITAADTAQTQAGANATQSANQQANAAAQIASAQDGIASAERSLAQARAQAADGAVTAANRVTAAQQSVADAERNAADAAVTAAERVESTRRAVTTATENAAFSVQSAINAQISAEEALANAQRAEQTAQENLTQARKDAADQLQSLTFSVQDNALNQRAADLSLQQAEANLAGLGSGATQLQRDQAQLAVDQAKQRIVELQAQGKQLADQKADADQKGIEGSSQVTAAQDAVTASIQRTGDAQRALDQATANVTKAQTDGARSVQQAEQAQADAERAQATQKINSTEAIAKAEQQRDDALRAQAMQQVTSANSIASAQQGVTSAQRALESAQRSAAQATDGASTATKAYQQALAGLSPAGRDFVAFYESQLKPKFDELKAAAQSGLLPGLQAGVTAAFPALDQLKTFVGNVAGAMGDLAKEAGAALTSPFWHDFFDFMNRTAGPTIKTLGETFGNFVTGVAGIMQALYEPVFVPIMNWFKDLSDRVKNFGTSAAAGTNSTFNAFLQYVKDNGPTVRDIIGKLVELITKIVEGMAGQGASTLSILLDVLKWINTLSPSQIQDLIDLFIAIKVAQLGAKLLSDLDGVIGKLKTIKDMGGIKGALGTAALTLGAAAGGALAADAVLPENTPQQSAAGASNPLGSVGNYTAHDRDELKGIADAIKNPAQALQDLQKQLNDFPAQFDKSPFMNFWRGIPGFFSGLGKQISSGASGIKADISKWWDDDVYGPTRDFFTSLPGTVSKWWTDNVSNPTRDFFAGLPGTVKSWWTTNVWNPTRDWFTSLPGTISAWWTTNVWNPTNSFFTGLPETVKTWWNTNVWNPTRDWFTGLPATVTGWWNTNVWNPTSAWFTGLPGTVTGWWNTNVWNPTSAWFTGLPATVKGWWDTNVWNPTSAWFTGLPATVKSWWTTNVSDPTGAWFAALPATVTKWWSDYVTTPLQQAATSMWTGIKGAFTTGLNGVIDALNGMTGGINVVLRLVHVPDIPPIPHFAAGGIVPGYSPGVDSVPAMLSPGEAVLVPELVRSIGPSKILAANAAASGRPAGSAATGFAGGGIIGDIGDWISGAAGAVSSGVSSIGSFFSGAASQVATWVGSGVSGLVDQIKNSVRSALPAGLFADMGTGAAGNILDGVVKVIQDAFTAQQAAATAGGGPGGPAPAGQVSQWIAEALSILGFPQSYAAGIYQQIMTESGGNPRAVQHGYTDVNTLSGNLAQGIMQVIPPTFRANMLPGHGDPFNPVDNIIAGSRYAMNRYGAGWFSPGPQHSHGYDEGGLLMPGMTAALNQTGKPERILTPDQNNSFERLVALAQQSQVIRSVGDTSRGLSPLDLQGLQTATAEQTAELKSLNAMLKRRGAGASITVNDHSGDPAETARATSLALRFA